MSENDNKKKKEDDNKPQIDVDAWKVVSFLGKGVVNTVKWVGNAPENISNIITDGIHGVRDAMAITEITIVFNTTDEHVLVSNREATHDDREVKALRAASLRTNTTDGAFIPWYDPPNKLRDFSRRHLAFLVNDEPVLYVWQRGHYIYWCNELDAMGQPAKSYKMNGDSDVGGRRMLVFRYDPDFRYSAFLTGTGAEDPDEL